MFLTMPLTVAPSCSEARSCSRSAPAVSSSTARRDTTTLFLLRSSLMTLKSISLPSYGVVSVTGRRSTSEPGRKARMPFVITVRPPFTLPVMTPFTFSPFSSDFSSSSHAAMRFALSRERRVAPKPSSSASIETLTKSPGLTSTCPVSFLNSSAGMMLSDFSPALTTTQLSSTLSTSAVITSPTRISLRLRLSSKRAAKDSLPEEAWGDCGDFWAVAGEMLAIKKKPFQTAGLRPRASSWRPGGLGPPTFLFAPPADDSLDHFVDRKRCRVEHLRIGRGSKRRDRPLGVALVALPQIAGKGAKISIDSFFYQLLIAPFGPGFRGRCQEDLEFGVREHHGAHVAPVGDQAGRPAEGALALEQRLAQPRQLRHLGGAVADHFAPHL